MRLKPAIPFLLVLAGGLAAWQFVPWPAVLHWAVTGQREFQDAMARALRAAQAGEPAAVWALCSATALYGFVHALGPGHGKVLLGGAALASGATLRRMTWLTLAASLAQAASAILLVGALAVLLGLGARTMGDVADAWLAPASYVAIAAIGGYLIFRGLRLWRAPAAKPCTSCGHAHGPTLEETASLSSGKDALLLIGSVAIRPCTGALFVLAIALRFEIFWIGALAVVAMGLGSAAFNLTVAWSGVAARRFAVIGASGGELRLVSAGLHIAGGALIAALSVTWLVTFAL
ncbi:nickel/cobalt transporter [Jannaschia aquimarina]|uniref:Nickel/cobalt efflux system n=1 Tax=Jannaschia aquimarina TaxID=935700 RepID=A0A0D1EFV6_9RHOB|nr:hypothetical protein [Jannaschia aquimarina]KIT15761.1 nickel/cobalt efflux protein RcnA [Jannaschia aquimarina]SNT31881.1 ABC-type nickel/cobalt efflux system, permease component RcnA [Jannaschia aquimarina]